MRGLAELELVDEFGLVLVTEALTPPPPRNGLAMRPKLRGDEVAAFWAAEINGMRKSITSEMR